MCSGCITCGKKTRLGKGKRRVVPLNTSRGENGSLMCARLFLFQVWRWIRPFVGSRIETDRRDGLFLDFNSARLVGNGKDGSEAAFHLRPELILVQAPITRTVRGHVVA